ncbi:hypothetical protein JCM3770_000239 [Rhodotorula araucariae]
MSSTMKALVLKGAHKVSYQDMPMPEIVNETDAIVKVEYTGLCGSDLHWYRGHQKWDGSVVILGHEFVGKVHAVGSKIKNSKVGDSVTAPFTCLCYYCDHGASSRCENEYAYVTMADSTLVHAPGGMSAQLLILLADIFPTRYWVARNGFRLLQQEAKLWGSTVLVIGCRPVGLCAITAATHYFETVIAVDPVAARREQAKVHSALAFNFDELEGKIAEITNGRGVDSVLEVIGNASALDLALQHVRAFGSIASCGVHAGGEPTTQITCQGLYNKNSSLQFGRCPVKSVFADALACLQQHDDLFKGFVQHIVPLSDGPKYFVEFEAQLALQRGHRVTATCCGNAPKRLPGLAAAVAITLPLDVCDTPTRINAVVRQAVATYGSIDVLVNNAGYVHQGAHEELTHEEERAAYETNVFGALKVTRAILPYFRAQRSGLVLNMSSHCGRWSRATYAVYSGTKFALEGFSEAIACETEHLGITVCALEPSTFAISVLEPERCLMPPENRRISD